MPRLVNRLNNSSVRTLGAGEHLDGGGLYLVVGPGGSRSWIFRYRFGKGRRRMGIGPFPTGILYLSNPRGGSAMQPEEHSINILPESATLLITTESR